jgi:hypothetical protein
MLTPLATATDGADQVRRRELRKLHADLGPVVLEALEDPKTSRSFSMPTAGCGRLLAEVTSQYPSERILVPEDAYAGGGTRTKGARTYQMHHLVRNKMDRPKNGAFSSVQANTILVRSVQFFDC